MRIVRLEDQNTTGHLRTSPIATNASTARMFLFVQPTRANDAVEPFRYGNVGITRLSVDLKDYVMDFTRNEWTKPYFAFLSINDAYVEPMRNAYETSGIDSFSEEPVFCVDLTGELKQSGSINQTNTLTVNISRIVGGANFDLFALILYGNSTEFNLMNGVHKSC